jgi:hypothetical protein
MTRTPRAATVHEVLARVGVIESRFEMAWRLLATRPMRSASRPPHAVIAHHTLVTNVFDGDDQGLAGSSAPLRGKPPTTADMASAPQRHHLWGNESTMKTVGPH